MTALATAEPLANAGTVRRRLLVNWQDFETRRYHHVGWLSEYVDRSYGFDYLATARTLPRFHPFAGFSDLDRSHWSPNLFPFFSQRLLSSHRADLPRLLHALDLDNDEPFEFLARSGGRRGGDTVELLPEPTIASDGSVTCLFLVRGVRYVPGADQAVDELMPRVELQLQSQPANPVNPRALLVTHQGQALGWVPDPLLNYVHALSRSRVTVVRANPSDLGHHLRLLVRLEGTSGSE